MNKEQSNGGKMLITGLPNILNKKVFICDCNAPEHQFIIDRFEDEHEVYISIRLNSYGNVFHRLWQAIKYVLKVDEASYDEVILNEDKQKELFDFLVKNRILGLTEKLKQNKLMEEKH